MNLNLFVGYYSFVCVSLLLLEIIIQGYFVNYTIILAKTYICHLFHLNVNNCEIQAL